MSAADLELPSGWLSLTLGEVIPYGATEKAEPEDLLPETWVLELEDVEKGTTKILTRLTYSDRQSKSTKNVFYAGDVLYGKLRPYLNKIVFADSQGVCTTEIVPIRPNAAVQGKYLFYWLRHPLFLQYVTEVSHGVNMPRLGTDAGRQAPFVLAPEKEQTRIADKLDTVLTRVDACRDRLARVAPLLKRFRQSVLAAATSGRLTEDWRVGKSGKAHEEIQALLLLRAKTEKKPPADPDLSHWNQETPSNWALVSVHQFAECLDRLRVPIKRENRSNQNGLYPYYGANGEVGRIDEFIFDDEIVLVTEDETFYGREKPIAYRSSGKCWVNNHAHVLRASTKVGNDYLCFSLMHYDVIPWLTGTTGRAKLTQQALNSLPILIPPHEEMVEIVRRVETLFAFADRLEARLKTAQTAADRLTPALLAKAFRGELVPQDPNDEPAAELLKRLADSRDAAPKAKRGRRSATADTTP